MAATGRLPSFFKVVLDPCRPHLPLPPGFISKLLENEIPENLMLRSVNGEYSWRLTIKKVGEVYCFANGWNNVVEDTQLGVGDILVFRLVDESTFKLSIYSPDGCEKDFPSKIQVEDDDDDDDDGGEEEDHGEDVDGVGDIDGNPFFMTILSKGHKFCLRLPLEFARLAGIDEEERMIRMKNLEGKEWQMRLKSERSHYKRSYLSSGWINFRRDNELSEGDKCVFRFIKSEDKLCLAKVIKKKRKVPATEVMKRTRGRRPPRVEVVVEKKVRSKKPADKAPAAEVLKRKRGRPPRVEVESKDEDAKVVKRSRGRPIKRKRGRPLAAHVK